jgi:hypothetical protein
MAIADKYDIKKDSKGLYYIYVDRRGISWKTRVQKTHCKTCGKEMHQIIRNGTGVQKYCCRKCRPVRRGFKRDKSKMDMSGLEKGRGWNKGLREHISEETREKMRAARIGKVRENSPNWKGGTRSEDKLLRGRHEYIEWRAQVFERDDYICQHCGKRGVELNAHHIKSFKHYPKSRYDVNNGTTLCIPCHVEEHKTLRKEAKNGKR